MEIHMPTVTLVSVLATAILGLVLCYIWWRERSDALIGWWGIAQIILATGISFGGAAASTNSTALSVFGQSLIALSAGVQWKAVREFEGRSLNPAVLLLCPAIVAVISAVHVVTFDERLILVCTMLATLYLLAASELVRKGSQQLVSRIPAAALLVMSAIGYLAWMPLVLLMPVREVGLVYSSAWMAEVVLAALLCRIALSFIILAVVKERQEQQQRAYALTDPLTGLPNRRALFAAANTLAAHSKFLKGDPIAVMVFDLDHFKNVNDTFGHSIGDRVLRLFADTISDHLDAGSIFGRLGGEEFAAILPGAGTDTAARKAESIRAAFEDSAGVIDGLPVTATVSIGVAVNESIACELGVLFHRADGALYAAKQAGRNRVRLIAAAETAPLSEAEGTSPRWFPEDSKTMPRPGLIRRYRGSGPGADAA
jgi:diguanylate cyclase (GGDEF)-like protein